MIPQEKITEIQHASDIVQIISEYIHLKQSGRNFIGLCPFHSEKTPSFTVNPEKKFFKCFGCGEGGTVFHFVMKQEGIDFIESVKLVASKAHINIAHLIPTKASFSPTEKTFLLNITNFATKFYNKILFDKESGSSARAYLQQRHINNQSIKTFCLGYAPNSWDALIKTCKERNIPNKLLEKVGLVIQKKEGNGYYDRFRNRLIFPILDIKKQVIGFGGRTLDDTTPKYLNSPETVLFNKSNVLYGIDIAKNAILKQHRVILMEGYTDVIMAHQYGIEWSVAVLGTAISKQHLRHLRQYCNQVILLLDSDIAGWKSSDRSLDIFIEEEFDVKIAQLPKDHDPCDFLVSEGVEKFLTYINNATDFFSYKVKMAASKWDISTIHGKANAINDVLATAMKMPDIIKRNLLIKRIAEEMSIDEATLRIQQKKFNKVTASIRNKQVAEQRLDASSRAERELLYLMLSCNDLIPRVVEEIGLEEFSNKDFSKIAQKMVALYYQNNVVHDQDILYAIDDETLNKICMDIVTTKEFQDITNHKERLEAYVVFFKKQNSKKDIHQTKKKMLEIVKAGSNEKDIVMLLEEFHKKSRNIHTLKK
ncbi:MAG: DNA primase [Candidatus Jettenia sp.]|uniref:DNA primase n=1 Tax=Candidatus Jettenia caeni TaxID=247490 RepID=I3IGM2_9BACT|nr:DNA primase [Candidatus Jettenia sp. AMX1]MBC6927834.1 DNA primase [Candidatus Jettenia sp.]NUN23498.1 DNA primase [Candidatus Jettenia caeni]KAA0251244.1 MAG: DNA primase [Candidatus Jettenia sp. AMX1]MCE7880266.1 DNA primase [Candidatus Jettenia sp. AMX1]MCQ3926201.1 DNA primase [Candidatus Jettenia sp.]